MSIAKRGSRPIEVDGEVYRWRVRSRPTADQQTGRTPLILAVAGEDGKGPALVVRLHHAHPSNAVSLRSEAVTPRQVAAYVRAGKRAGWSPSQPGRPFHLSPHGVEQPDGPRAWPRRQRPPSPAEIEAIALARPAAGRDVFRLVADRPYVRWPNGGGYQPCGIEINGVDLIALARAAELPHAEREIARRAEDGDGDGDGLGVDDLAGNYLGLALSSLRWPRRELFDAPTDTAGQGFVLSPDDPRRGKTTVLGCACGVVECWFLLVSIAVFDDVVVWFDFEQFHRPWVYDLGPFVFDRSAYLRALGAND
jgi:hypothetical protein